MSDDHIDKLLSNDAADKELDAEIKAYEAEQAEVTEEPASEPVEDAEGVQEELELRVEEKIAEIEEKAEAEAEEEKQPEAPKQVDLKALQAVRAENQQLKQQMNQLSLYMQQLQQNMTPQQQAEQEQEPIPDPDENPIEALSWLMKQQAQQAKTQQERAEQERQQAYQAQITQTYAQQAQQFEAQTPDFRDAYNHLIQNRARELELAGMPQDQIAAQINREELNMAAHAFRNGANPAQQIYEMAKLRGYAPKPRQAPVSPQVRQEMEEARKAASINTNRSAPPAKGMTLEQIAELNGAAFDKALAKWERENGLGPKSIV